MVSEPHTLIATEEKDYALLDSGDEMKLERFGEITVARPDPQALWQKQLNQDAWEKADATFVRDGQTGKWNRKRVLPNEWAISYGGLAMTIKLTSFKHTGLFPEQLPNWQWADTLIRTANRPVSILNLFGYTGGATLAAASSGASVCHVDGSKKAVEWARANAVSSHLEEKPIRWIVEDALTFVRREIKRGRKYDGIILDPPAFGHGPADEIWKIEEHFRALLTECLTLLSDTPLFILLNGYSSGYSSLSYVHNLQEVVTRFGGTIEHGELTIKESGPTGRLLPAGIYARWCLK